MTGKLIVFGPELHNIYLKLYMQKLCSSFNLFLLLQPISWKSFIVLLVAGGGVIWYVRKLKQEKEEGGSFFVYVRVYVCSHIQYCTFHCAQVPFNSSFILCVIWLFY